VSIPTSHPSQALAAGDDSADPLGPDFVAHVYRSQPRADSFKRLEDRRRPLGPGVSWRRRRLAWVDEATGEERGLCVNELRLSRNTTAHLSPLAATQGIPYDFDAIENAYWQTVWAGGALRIDRGKKESRLFLDLSELVRSAASGGAPSPLWSALFEAERRIENTGMVDEAAWAALAALHPRHVEQPGAGRTATARFVPAFLPSAALKHDFEIIAATNAGYFLNFPEEYSDGISALHQNAGALYADERLVMPPWIERPAAIEWKDGTRRIEMLAPENLELLVTGHESVPLRRGIDALSAPATVWRAFDGLLPEAPVGVGCVDLVFSGAGVVKASRPGQSRAPHGGALVRLTGRAAEPWLAHINSPLPAAFPHYELRLVASRRAPIRWVLAAGPRLLLDGHRLYEAEMFLPMGGGEFRPQGPPPTRFPYDATKTRAPRTAIGVTQAEEWLLAVVDGRADPKHSVGATLEELSGVMHALGAYGAINLDGGGSSVMAVRGLDEADQVRPGLSPGVVNLPSDPGARERIVPVALTIRA